MQIEGLLRDASLSFHGVDGVNLEIESANPANYHQAMSDAASLERVTLDGKLFLPRSDEPLPLVLIVPGSLGVGPNHLTHAETLVGEGSAVFVLDPFGARSVVSTVANQVQYSFAASAFDVLAALRVLREQNGIDPDRIAAQGHSRGGSAVTIAAMRQFADPIVGSDVAFASIYAVYPWCGHQFVDPQIGQTRFRAIVGERDAWVSVQQVQAQAQAIRLAEGEASVRVVPGAHHSFDRLEAVHTIEDAAVAPGAPTVYLAHDGAAIDPRSGEPDAALCDYEMFRAAMKGGHGRIGAPIGGQAGEPELFRADMLGFHRRVLNLR